VTPTLAQAQAQTPAPAPASPGDVVDAVAGAAPGPDVTGGPAASPAGTQPDATVQEGADQAVKLLNDFSQLSVFTVLVIVVGTWIAIVLVRTILPYLAERGPNQLRLYLLGAVPILRLLLLVIAALSIVQIVFNINRENFFVIAGSTSVALGFAFKDYASSLIAGIVAIFEKPYRPGDWVEIDGDYGEVVGVGLRALAIRTPDDNVVSVPHLVLWDKNVSNANDGARTLQCVADFYVAPDHDAAAVRSALQDVGLTSGYLGYDRPVEVVLREEPWGTHYKLKAYPFDMRDQFRFISDLTARGKHAIRACGAVAVTAPMGVADGGG